MKGGGEGTAGTANTSWWRAGGVIIKEVAAPAVKIRRLSPDLVFSGS